jgi:spore coat polysaccharide biosynthesis protein SpsF
MSIVAIIQARMTSTRLPGKIMADIAGEPLLAHVVRRAQLARGLSMVVVATTDQSTDHVVVTFCRDMGIPCFRGSEDDVLDRYYRAAVHFEADVIVRLTADCPLLDPKVIDKVVDEFYSGDYDYVSNTIEPTYPDGLDTEVFGRTALQRAWETACLKSEREHVTPFIWKQPAMFNLANVKNDRDLSQMRWTVDEPEDLEFIRSIYHCMGSKPFWGMEETVALLHEHPELSGINASFRRNEGYIKSVQADVLIKEKQEK